MTWNKTLQIAPDEEIGFMTIDVTDFSSFCRGELMRHFEVEGYVVFPSILSSPLIDRLKQELADAEMDHKSYSQFQTFSKTQPQWLSRAVAELIAHPPMIEFLSELMGPDIVFTRGFFQRTHPGSPGISMHTDGQPYGSDIFGFEGSCPRLVRVLYYLDELTPDRAPFRLIPRSHLSFHANANPYVRYKSHPQEKTICVPAGSAVVIPAMLFHGSHPNKDSQSRELIQFGYRPSWSGPIQPVEAWNAKLVESAPTVAQRFLQDVNQSGIAWEQPHKPADMKTKAPGIDPNRWDKK